MAKATGSLQNSFMVRFVEPIAQYLRDTRAELRKVTWPSRKEAWHLTLVVLAVTAGMAAVLGLADFAFQEIMRALVLRNWPGYVAAVAAIAVGFAGWYYIRRE